MSQTRSLTQKIMTNKALKNPEITLNKVSDRYMDSDQSMLVDGIKTNSYQGIGVDQSREIDLHRVTLKIKELNVQREDSV